MVFLFPGILFRRFYFTGKFSNQFNQGNLLERFLWTLFFSMVAISATGFIIYIINEKTIYSFLHNIDFDTICNIFASLASNHFPDAFTDKDKVAEMGMVLLITYVFSGATGFLITKFIRSIKLDQTFSTLRFSNDWIYLSEAHKETESTIKLWDYYYTSVDILISQKEKEELYRGNLKHLLFDKENKLENIAISQAAKFISLDKTKENAKKIKSIKKSFESSNLYEFHREDKSRYVVKKNIEGNIFVLPAQNILNVNFTYVKIFKGLNKVRSAISNILRFLSYLAFAPLVITPFIKLQNQHIDSLWEKIVFFLFSGLIIAMIFDCLGHLIKSGDNTRKTLIDNFIFVLWFSIPYFWVFEVINGYIVAAFMPLAFVGVAYLTQDETDTDFIRNSVVVEPVEENEEETEYRNED